MQILTQLTYLYANCTLTVIVIITVKPKYLATTFMA